MNIEIRADSVVLDGYVNAVGRDSLVLASPKGRFVEQVEPGTFARALRRGHPIELRLNHGRTLGSTAEGTLELREDSIGLRATATVTDPEVMACARNGKLRGWSFGFHSLKDRWEDWRDGIQRRYLEDIDVREVSLVDSTRTPAYTATSVEERDGEACVIEERTQPGAPEITDSTPPKEAEEAPIKDNTMAEHKRRRLKLGGRK